MAGPNETIVRRVVEVLNTCKSVDEAIATGVEELWDPEIEFVNPEDAVERGTRKGAAGMRTVLENFIAGAGAGATVELEELQEREDRVLWKQRKEALEPALHRLPRVALPAERVIACFEVKQIAVKGWPWDMWVAVEWIDRAEPRDRVPYENEGAHWIRLQRGKATYIHAYLDAERVTATCERLAATGVEEAAAPPITD